MTSGVSGGDPAVKPPSEGPDARVAALAGSPVRTVEAEALFSGGREVVIAHRGERYRLSITQAGKLILTK